ncbi:hypothetical protein SH528x_004313 [Novipirellula sp. SH528]|uniref:hypothetical protein n=1 Tax=Novipirellula sp. SH528 TaxID=3454466 RepID=UPI003F9FC60A
MTSPQHVCPFCPLHCDDISVDKATGREWIAQIQCPTAIEGYTDTLSNAKFARIEDAACEIAEADNRAKVLLSEKDILLVATRGTDLNSARRLNQLEGDNRIRVALDDTVSTQAWRNAVSREGTLTATLGDIQSHADVVWIIGDVESETPRLRERISADTKNCIHSESLAAETLAELFASLRIDPKEQDSKHEDTNEPIAKAMRSANYLAIILGRDALVRSEATATSELLSKLLWHLNKTKRAVVLQLDAAATNRAVTAWRSNLTIDSISDSDQEIHVRLGSPANGARTAKIQIGGIDRGPRYAEVYLPAAICGIDRDGIIVRGDATVTMALIAIQSCSLPTPLERLEQWRA